MTSQTPLFESQLTSVPLLFRGKVRDIYDLGDALLLVASDRLSAFDVVLPTPIPEKGRILTEMSHFWFERTAHIVKNHALDRELSSFLTPSEVEQVEGRSIVGMKAKPIKIEAIVRGYLAGSGFKEYTSNGTVCGIQLPDDLVESSRLPHPIFTPSTKADRGEHDENISFEKACDIVGRETAEEVRDLALRIYSECAEYALSKGLLLADTKMEFGRLESGELILIDELLTPDSSRFWDSEVYQPGRSQPAFDKQYVRDWLLESGFNRQPPAPTLPQDVVAKTTEKYLDAMKRLTA